MGGCFSVILFWDDVSLTHAFLQDVILEPLHFLQCHSKSNSREDFKTQLWSCAFEPLLDGGTRKGESIQSLQVAFCDWQDL